MTFPRSDLASIPLYAPSALIGVALDLRDNLSPAGVPPAALRALRSADEEILRAYPSPGGAALVQSLAARLKIDQATVVVGCGSDDLLFAALRAAVAPGSRVAHPDPSFAMMPIFARLSSLVPVAVPLASDGVADIDALLATEAAVIYVCSPNNPTGAVSSRDALLRLIDRAPGLVIVDEAYAEFCEAHDLRREAAGRSNLLVLRTFSKAWGLAGLRVGYAVGSAELAAAVAKARGPYTLNALGERAALAALEHDEVWLQQNVDAVRSGRARLESSLRTRAGVRVFPSAGNFVFAAVADSRKASDAFLARGIAVRAFRGLPGIGDALRIGVPPADQLERLLTAFAEIWP